MQIFLSLSLVLWSLQFQQFYSQFSQLHHQMMRVLKEKSHYQISCIMTGYEIFKSMNITRYSKSISQRYSKSNSKNLANSGPLSLCASLTFTSQRWPKNFWTSRKKNFRKLPIRNKVMHLFVQRLDLKTVIMYT